MSAEKYSGFIISGIALCPEQDESEACSIAREELKRAGVSPARLHFSIYKRSVDARKKNDIKIVYSVACRFDEAREAVLPNTKKYRVALLGSEELTVDVGSEKAKYRPLVVGMGPAGLFAALLLAQNGYRPIIIDRGESVWDRQHSYERFVRFGVLDTESNIQFGAGGAGTFSDGKLLTRINDPKISYVLRTFCEFGAPESIMYEAKPHIGTDLLLGIVDKMLARIGELGGEVRYRTRLENMVRDENKIKAITTGGDILCSVLVLATGHSARDTYEMLIKNGYTVTPKAFSVGVRIEHLRKNIDRAMYGDMAGHPKLGRGEYHLSDTSRGRGVYTFCMCPGGEVVAGASEEGGVVVNGMSKHARNGVNSNSAIAVSVLPDDYGNTPRGAIEFQRRIERAAFAEGGSDYAAPIMTVGDFLGGRSGSEPTDVIPTYREGRVRTGDFARVLPSFVCEELRHGILSFERKLCGFSASSAIITAAETRTSAPLRIQRDENGEALQRTGIYPCGEGAGYAGGITSSAIDGIATALKIIKKYAPAD